MVDKMDLRIGNKVTLAHESNEPIVTVEKIGYNEVYVAEINRVFHYEDLMPIMLSPELLVKCGFKETVLRPYIDQDAYIVGVDAGQYIYSAGALFKPLPDGYVAISQHHMVYLHQIQNCIYTLTNTEITVNI